MASPACETCGGRIERWRHTERIPSLLASRSVHQIDLVSSSLAHRLQFSRSVWFPQHTRADVMTTKIHGMVINAFSSHEQAREAIRRLRDAGFTESEIGIASAHNNELRAIDGDDAADESYAGEGAATGLAAGAGIGALWGLGILSGVLPAIGPAIAGGTLAVILSSAAAGAAAAGLTGALIGMGISKEEAEFYESEMRSGRTVVTVNAGSRRSEALAIMQQAGGYDMSNRLSGTSTTHEVPVSGQSLGASTRGMDPVAGSRSIDVPVTDVDPVTGNPRRLP
jgi:hypothetical protein